MESLARVGEFCPNPACPNYGKRKPDNIKRVGKTKRGRQRYQCKTCGLTFTETKGTLFYRKRTSEKDILETLALLSEGVRISSLARAKGHKEETILGWLREAAFQAEGVEEVLMANYKVKRGQLDALWSYVGNKGEKGAIKRPKREVSSGGQR